MDIGDNIEISEPAIQAAVLGACFSFCLWTVKTIVEARVAWRKQRLERTSKLLDEYWWPLLLLLVELRDAQTILENADTATQASTFKDMALKRKVELSKKLADIMTGGIALAQPRSIIIAPMLSAYQQIGFMRLGADPTHTLTLTHIEVLLSLVQERLKLYQSEYNAMTESASFKLCPQKRDEESPGVINALRRVLDRSTGEGKEDDFAELMNIFSVETCGADACTIDANMSLSQSARETLSSEFAKAYRRSRIDIDLGPDPAPETSEAADPRERTTTV